VEELFTIPHHIPEIPPMDFLVYDRAIDKPPSRRNIGFAGIAKFGTTH
jgi:hypothetical protein